MIHLYNACAPGFRRIVFNMNRAEVKQVAIEGTQCVMAEMAKYPQTNWFYEYSPEVFSTTEPDFALEVCNAVTEVWQPTPQKKIVYNLPATIEATTPNMYADQIEYMHNNLNRRDSIVISVHPHNDRGTAVAAAELGVMAGADRIEGCLFGNGERTGNVDLVTLALNLYTQGIHPGLDFSDIDEVRRCVEYCNQLPVHPRHPYVGDLVFTAFSGSHQDAIKKGFAVQKPDALWEVPYLPLDPADLGRTYESVIRVNSQSGKGGISFLLERHHGLVMPRRLQVEFSSIVQRHTDEHGTEVNADDLWKLFSEEYLSENARIRMLSHHMVGNDGGHQIDLTVSIDGVTHVLHGRGNGPIDAAVQALGLPVRVDSYEERSIDSGADARAVAFIEATSDGVTGARFGVGIDRSIVMASLRALISAANRLGLADRFDAAAARRAA
jgi:2-isopropylmalate synthase